MKSMQETYALTTDEVDAVISAIDKALPNLHRDDGLVQVRIAIDAASERHSLVLEYGRG